MIVVYVLKSIPKNVFYVGMTKNIDQRLIEHNSGKSKYTSHATPWELVYQENCSDYASGRIREKYLKSAAGKRYLKTILNK